MVAPTPRLRWSSRPPNSAQAVAITVDGNAYPFAAFLAAELRRLEPDGTYDILVLLTDGGRPNPALLPEARLGALDDAGWTEGLPVTRSIPRAAYSRLLLAEALPAYDSILYLDADILPLRPGVDRLFRQPPPATISAAPDYSAWLAPAAAGATAISRNSGVQLIDAARARRDGTSRRILDFARANKPRLKQHDQSALNLALGDELGLMSPIWNWLDVAGADAPVAPLDPALLHFVSHSKPWDWTPGHRRMVWFPRYAAFLEERLDIPLRRETEAASWTRVNAGNRVHRWGVSERLSLWWRRRRLAQKPSGRSTDRTIPAGRLAELAALADC